MATLYHLSYTYVRSKSLQAYCGYWGCTDIGADTKHLHEYRYLCKCPETDIFRLSTLKKKKIGIGATLVGIDMLHI